MSDAAHYRGEALRFLRWAEAATEPDIAGRWRRLADDYVTLAEEIDAPEIGRPPILRPARRQAEQQQQSKSPTGPADG